MSHLPPFIFHASAGGGSDLRTIQELLGGEDGRTTKICACYESSRWLAEHTHKLLTCNSAALHCLPAMGNVRLKFSKEMQLITFSDSIEVEATTEEVFEWLVRHVSDTELYKAWHPDHVGLRWIKGEPVKEGSIVCADEYLHGVLHRLKFRILKIVPNKRIEYRSLFPLSLLAPGNSFVIEPKDDGRCIFTASGSLRLPRWLFEKLGKSHKGKVEATKRHMKEEGENLKKALEAKAG